MPQPPHLFRYIRGPALLYYLSNTAHILPSIFTVQACCLAIGWRVGVGITQQRLHERGTLDEDENRAEVVSFFSCYNLTPTTKNTRVSAYLNRCQNRPNIINGTPMILKDVKADAAIGVHCHEIHSFRNKKHGKEMPNLPWLLIRRLNYMLGNPNPATRPRSSWWEHRKIAGQ